MLHQSTLLFELDKISLLGLGESRLHHDAVDRLRLASCNSHAVVLKLAAASIYSFAAYLCHVAEHIKVEDRHRQDHTLLLL